MSFEAEAAGDLIDAGLVASEMEDGGDATGHAAHEEKCANCATPLAGHYCHACGQSSHLHHSLLHLGEEVLHGLFHFDAKGWRTIPMLVLHPGRLTRDYINGQRTRYVSPLALFLFLIFAMFFAFSYTKNPSYEQPKTPEARAKARVKLLGALEQSKTEVVRAEAALEKASKQADKVDDAKEELQDARNQQAIDELALKELDANAKSAQAKKKPAEADNARWIGDLNLELANFRLDSSNSPLKAQLQRALNNPELTLYKLKDTASKFAFALVPISLPFLWLMFIMRRDVTMYDHAVFSLYSLSFMALLCILLALLVHVDMAGAVLALLLLIPPIHMFRQLRAAYALSNAGALWRTVVLLGVAGTVFMMFLLLIMILTLK